MNARNKLGTFGELSTEMVRTLGNLRRQLEASISKPAKNEKGETTDLSGYSPEALVGGRYAPKHTCEALANRGLVNISQDKYGLSVVRINQAGLQAISN